MFFETDSCKDFCLPPMILTYLYLLYNYVLIILFILLPSWCSMTFSVLKAPQSTNQPGQLDCWLSFFSTAAKRNQSAGEVRGRGKWCLRRWRCECLQRRRSTADVHAAVRHRWLQVQVSHSDTFVNGNWKWNYSWNEILFVSLLPF